jgi:hypothetical protein
LADAAVRWRGEIARLTVEVEHAARIRSVGAMDVPNMDDEIARRLGYGKHPVDVGNHGIIADAMQRRGRIGVDLLYVCQGWLWNLSRHRSRDGITK